MNTLRQALDAYLDMRRNLGFQLREAGKVAPQLIVVMSTIARSGVAESEKDVHAASVVPSEAGAHETTAVHAPSSNDR